MHQNVALCGNGLKTEIIISSTFDLSSANALNLVQSKILSFGKELITNKTRAFNPMSDKILDLPKLKAFTQHKCYSDEIST